MLELLLAKLGIPLEEAQRSFVGEGCEPAAAAAVSAACMPGKSRLPTLPPHALCPHVPSRPRPADDMAPRYRHSLQEKLAAHAPAFRMSDITFKSFQLQARWVPGGAWWCLWLAC